MNGDDDFNWGETSEDTSTDPFADDDFFSTPEGEKVWQDEQLPNDDTVQQQSINEEEVFSKPRQKSPLGFKAVAGIIVGFLIILALTLTFIDKISFTKKAPQPPTEAQQQMQQGAGENTQSSTQQQEPSGEVNDDFSDKGGMKGSNVGSSNTDSIKVDEKINTDNSQKVSEQTQVGGMQELPNDVDADYTGDVYESDGTIKSKTKYLENSQVVYCLEIEANIGDKSKLIKYYCGYNTFDSVSTGDKVSVTYQVVSDTCYSVNTISK